jgi:hypothetical protein
MADRDSNVVALDPEPSRQRLLTLLAEAHPRLVGIMGIVHSLSRGDGDDDDFIREALEEVFRSLDDILSLEWQEIASAYHQRLEVANG